MGASYLLLLLLTLRYVSLNYAQSNALVFPFVNFDADTSSTVLVGSDEDSQMIRVPNGFVFANTTQYSIYISTDGYLSFGRAVTCCPSLDASSDSEYTIAPFLADTNVVAGVGNVSYQVHSNSSNPALLNKVSRFMRKKNNNSFAGTWMLVVQWKNVSQFDQPVTPTNTFQGVVITNGFQSYTLFIYECGKMQWSGQGIIGFKANSALARIHRLSGSNASLVACVNSPESVWNNIVYELHLNELPFVNLDENRVMLPSVVEDSVSGQIDIEGTGFPFGNSNQTSVYVSTNGIISFRRPFPSHSPILFPGTSFYNYLVSPFWSDIDITNNVGEVSYQSYNNSESEALTFISTYIKQQQQVDFTGTWMLVAEWKDVPEYFGDLSRTNTFQGILVTDGQQSYGIFIYNCHYMEWSGRAGIGIKADGKFFKNHDLSRMNTASSIACLNFPESNWTSIIFLLHGDYLGFIDLSTAKVNLPPTLDSHSTALPIPVPFPFGIRNVSSVYVSSNGFISFNRSVNFFYPVLFPNSTSYQYIVAPFWADHDLRVSGKISYEVFTSNSDVILRVSRFIRQQTGTSFNGSWMLIVDWKDVAEYQADDDMTNSYQGLVITNGTNSYAIYTYLCGALTWGGNATIGYNAGGTLFENHPISGTSSVNSISCANYYKAVWTNILYKLTPNG